MTKCGIVIKNALKGMKCMKQYDYPLNSDWSTGEMIAVVNLLSCVEQAYETGINADKFDNAYQKFKQIVTSIAEEKRVGNRFEQVSTYSLYRVVQTLKKLKSEQHDLSKVTLNMSGGK